MNRKLFFDTIRNNPFSGALTPEQVDGITRILDEWERRRLTDLRWLAYMLGTTFWETSRTMQPIRERGGEAYLRSKKYYPWVGEGLVQVTWEVNHRKYGATAPGQLLTWPIALRALFDGMIQGTFTGKKLAHYFTDKATDWKGARRIINGIDKAAVIATIAQAFHKALKVAAGEALPPDVERPEEDDTPSPHNPVPPSPVESKTIWASIATALTSLLGAVTDWKVLAVLVVGALMAFVIYERWKKLKQVGV